MLWRPGAAVPVKASTSAATFSWYIEIEPSRYLTFEYIGPTDYFN